MRMLCRLLIVALVLAPAAALANVTVTDWRGVAVTAAEGRVDSDGVEIVFHTAGEGPLVVFVHSISGPWFDWRHQFVALSEHYRVAVMSTRGTNRSGKPQGVEHYTMAKISGDIAAIIRHLGEEKAIIVGQDSGGFYAWHFAMTHPEQTERLVSIGTIHPAGLIRELASNPEQQQASMFQRGMQENPDAPTAYGERIRSTLPRPGDTPELAELRAAAYERLDVESVANFYKANWPRAAVHARDQGLRFPHRRVPGGPGADAARLRQGQPPVHVRDPQRHLALGRRAADAHGPARHRPRPAHAGARDRHAGDSRVARRGVAASRRTRRAGRQDRSAPAAGPAATAAVQRLSNRTQWRSSRLSVRLTGSSMISGRGAMWLAMA